MKVKIIFNLQDEPMVLKNVTSIRYYKEMLRISYEQCGGKLDLYLSESEYVTIVIL